MRFVVESRSITCKDKWLTGKQRKEVVSFTLSKMLVAHRFPEIKFSSTGITKTASHQYDVRGDLTIRGMTRPTFIQVVAKQIGTERLEFDGHRVFDPATILSAFRPLRLRRFSYVDDSGDLVEDADPAAVRGWYSCGLFLLTKPPGPS